MNTFAVLSSKDLEADIKGSFPGVNVIGLSLLERARTLIREGSIGFLLTNVDHPRPSDLTKFRSLAREASRQAIPSLFVAETSDVYSMVRDVVASTPIVGVAFGRSEVRPMVNLLQDRAVRFHSPSATTAVTAPALDLDEHPLLQKETSFLRDARSGRLDARLISTTFGEPLKRFSQALDVSPAAVSQTPDSKKYQNFLSYFEKVARIIPMLESKDTFSAWVHTPNKELKGEAPIDWLFGSQKKARRLTEIVEDVIVGQPD